MSVNNLLTPFKSFRPEDVPAELSRRFFEQFDRADGRLKMFQDVANDPEFMGRLVAFFQDEESRNKLQVRFTYDMQLSDMIAAGKYDRFYPQYFPKKLEKVPAMMNEVRMPHLYATRTYWPKDLPEELDKKGLRSGYIPELLLYGANHRTSPGRLGIFCLNDQHPCYGDLVVLNYSENGTRGLGTYSSNGGDLPSGWRGFEKHHRIAVVDL